MFSDTYRRESGADSSFQVDPHEARNITLSRNGKLLKGKGEEQAMEDGS
jgi:hypothetical protein